MIGTLKRAWIPLLILVVVAIAGFTVQRIRTFFGSEGILVTPKVFADDPEPFDPKVVEYEVSGPVVTSTSTTWTSTPSHSGSTAQPCRGRSP